MSETQTPSPTTATVRLVGGPDDWRGATLSHLSAEELAGPREGLGAYLLSTCVSHGHPDPGARAVYEPDMGEAPADVWFFRGWVPIGPEDAELRTADHHQAVDVTLDGDGLPVEWTEDTGTRHRVDQVLAHWQSTGEDQLAPDVWHVRSNGMDWELRHYIADMWEAGPLPATEENME